MELRNIGINPNMPRSELVNTLSSQQIDTLLDPRLSPFEDLKKDGLAHTGDELVSQRVTRGGKPV